MSLQQDQPPGLPLPQPSFDVEQAPNTGMSTTAYQSSPGQPQPQTQPPQPYGAIPTANTTPTQTPSIPSANVPQQPLAAAPTQSSIDVSADDDTVVDQEWTAKAKEIVAKTHNDPYLQSKEISKIKAQYIKVRYNKDIKTVEE